jgi:hypothetical protein
MAFPVQTGFCDGATVILTGRLELTVIVMLLDVAGLFEVQVRPDVRIHITWSPFTGEYVNTGESVPELIPFTFHCQEGDDPSLTGFAVKVTEVPAQTLLSDAEIVTPTTEGTSTVTCTTFDATAPDQSVMQVTLESL